MNITQSLNAAGISFQYLLDKKRSENENIYLVSDVLHIQSVLANPLEADSLKISNSLLMASDNIPERHISEGSLGAYFKTEKGLILQNWIESANLVFLKSIAMALAFVDDDEERLKSCVNVRMFICSSPKFDNIGIFSGALKSKYRQLFPDEAQPVVTSIGISSLPKNVPISMDVMFKCAHK